MVKFKGVVWNEDDEAVPNKLLKEVEQMLNIDLINIQDNLRQVLHDSSQVLKTIYELTTKIQKTEIEVKEVTMTAVKFYNFESPRKLTSTQVQQALKNDLDIAEVELKLKTLNAQLHYFEKIYDELKQKSRNIKYIIEWEIYTQGNR